MFGVAFYVFCLALCALADVMHFRGRSAKGNIEPKNSRTFWRTRVLKPRFYYAWPVFCVGRGIVASKHS